MTCTGETDSGQQRRSETGETLIEVLLAVLVLGLGALAILAGFASSISASATHRQLATVDTVLKSAADEANSQIQQLPIADFTNCLAASYVAFVLPIGYTGTIGKIAYWNGTAFPTPSLVPTCSNPSAAELLTINVVWHGLTYSITTVVDDPFAIAGPVGVTPAKLAFVVQPGGAVAGQALAPAPQVAVEDINGLTVTSDLSSVQLVISAGTGTNGAILNNCTGSSSYGVVTFSNCSTNVAGTGYTMTATDGSLSPATSISFNVTAAAPNQFAITSSPVSATASPTATIGPITVQEQDQFGNPTIAAETVNLASTSKGTNAFSAASGGTAITSISIASGSSSMNFYYGDSAVGTPTVTASGGLISDTQTENITAGPAAAFVLQNPSSQIAGTAFNETITAVDAYGNTATGYTGAQTVTFTGPASSPSGTAPSYPASVTFSAGVGTASISLPDAQTTTLIATQGSLTDVTTSFLVAPLAASSFVAQNPTTQTAGTAFNETVTAVDIYGNTATTYTGAKTVTFTGPASSPSGTAPSYPASVTFTAGAGTASITLRDAQTTTITATQGSLTDVTTSFLVAPLAASSFVAQNPANQTAGTSFNETITAYDTYGNTATTYTGAKAVTFTGPANSPNASPSYPASVTFTAGVGTASITLVDAQTATLTATQGSLTDATTSFTVAPLAASAFVAQNPVNQNAGTAFNETVTAVDTYGNTITTYTGAQAVTFTGPASSPNGTAPSYPASVTFTAGVGTASINLSDAQTTTLTATQGSLTDATTSFTVAALGASSFSVANPGSPTAGTAFNQTLTAIDTYGNTATSFAGSVPVTFSGPANSPNGTSPTYPASVTVNAGVGTASITLPDAQTTTLTASAYGLSATSSNFTVGSAAGSSFVAQNPANQTAGTAFNETITAYDPYGNIATTYTGAKTITFTGPANSPNASPTYPASVTFTAGVGTAAITLVDAQTTTTLTATQGSLTDATTSFTVAQGAASYFGLSNPGPSVAAGTVFNEIITAYDAYGNTATNYTGTQSITITGPANSPKGTSPTPPSSPQSVTFSNGAGTQSITLVDAQTTTLTATQGGITGTSTSFTVTPLGASAFSVTNPGTRTDGAAFNETVTAVDTYGNTATSYIGAKTITFTGPASSPNATAPSYPASVSFTATGVGTASITLTDAQTTTLTATQGSFTGTSTSFAVGSAAASSLVAQNPANQTAGTAFNETITAYDTYGNIATVYTAAKTITFTGPANSPNNSPTYPGSVTFTAGVGTASITLVDAQTTTLTVTQGSLTDATTSFTVGSGPAVFFVLYNTSNQSAGTAFNEPITAFDSDDNTATTFTGAKTITFTGPANSPNATAPTYPASVTFTSGTATASITLPDAQTTTITATSAAVNGTSSSFTVAPLAASSFSVVIAATPTAGQSFTGTASSANGTNEITALDTYGNIATTYTGAKTVVFSGPANSPNGTAPVYPSSLTFTAGATASNAVAITLYNAASTTLTATVGSVHGTSNSITVSTSTATQLVFTTQPSGGAHNTAFASQPVLHLEDAWGNTTSSTAAVTLTLNSGTGTLTCTTNPVSSVGGVATFTGCKLSAAGTDTLKAAIAGFSFTVLSTSFTET